MVNNSGVGWGAHGCSNWALACLQVPKVRGHMVCVVAEVHADDLLAEHGMDLIALCPGQSIPHGLTKEDRALLCEPWTGLLHHARALCHRSSTHVSSQLANYISRSRSWSNTWTREKHRCCG